MKASIPGSSKESEKNSSYPKEVYALLAESEEKHFWFRGRNKVIREVIRSTFRNYQGKSFFEVGCGTGYVLAELARMGFRVTGLDMHKEGLAYAGQRVPSAYVVTGTLDQFRPKKLFDAVGMFDVLEHIPNDTQALRECSRLIGKNGMLYITVPARPELWSVYDDISGHKRRYTKSLLIEVLTSAGFRVRHVSYFGFFQYIPHLIMKRFILSGTSKDIMPVLKKVIWQPPGMINWLLEQSFALDMFLSRFIQLPFGTSLIVSAQKSV